MNLPRTKYNSHTGVAAACWNVRLQNFTSSARTLQWLMKKCHMVGSKDQYHHRHLITSLLDEEVFWWSEYSWVVIDINGSVEKWWQMPWIISSHGRSVITWIWDKEFYSMWTYFYKMNRNLVHRFSSLTLYISFICFFTDLSCMLSIKGPQMI